MTRIKLLFERAKQGLGLVWRGPGHWRSARDWLLPLAVVLAVVLATGASFLIFLDTTRHQDEFAALRADIRGARGVQQALFDLEIGASGYVLTSRLDYLQTYYGGLRTLDASGPTMALLDAAVKAADPSIADPAPFSTAVAELRRNLAELVGSVGPGSGRAPGELGALDRDKALMHRLRRDVSYVLAQRIAELDDVESHAAAHQQRGLVLQVLGGVLTLSALWLAFRRGRREAVGRARAVADAVRDREQVHHLFAMTDILQSAGGYADANAVLVATARRLLPGRAGALYIFSNSRDRLDLSVSWGAAEEAPAVRATIAPGECWAMKRGKPHRNDLGGACLRCEHAMPGEIALEIPMLARGEVLGLLQVMGDEGSAGGEFAGDEL